MGWIGENWFPLMQSAGIVAGLLLPVVALRRDAAGRRTANLLALGQQHRELWTQAVERPELCRIFRDSVDLLTQPVTPPEFEFMNMVIHHFNTGWELAKQGEVLTLETMSLDVATFFCLPIPKSVWKETRDRRDPQFVAFIEECLKAR